jgi:hypothetical protein
VNAAGRPARRRWPIALALMALAVLAAIALAWNLVDAIDVVPVSLTVDGERVLDGLDLAALPPAHRFALVALVVFAALTLLLAVPIALLLLLLALALVLLLPLTVALAALALVLSPLWLLGWLAWRALRPSAAPAGSTTIGT